MKEFGYLRAIYMSFYSPALYRDVAKNWGAGVFLYLFLLLLISWIVLLLVVQPAITLGFRHFADKVSVQLPEQFSIKNGELTTPKNEPYLIKDPDSGQLEGIIDTSGKYKSLDDVPKGTNILLTKDKVYYMDRNTLKIYKFPANLNYDVNTQNVTDFLKKYVAWLWVLLLPIFLLFSFFYRIIQAVLYAIIGKLVAIVSGIPLTYSTVFKLAMVAITPVIVILTILELFSVILPFEGLFFFVLAMIYLVFAVMANKTT